MNNPNCMFREILEKYKDNSISKEEINSILTNRIDIEYVLDSDDTLWSDLYYSLLHYSIGEEDFTIAEQYNDNFWDLD